MRKSSKPREFHDGVCDYCDATQVKCPVDRPCCACKQSGYCSFKYPKREDPSKPCYATNELNLIIERRR